MGGSFSTFGLVLGVLISAVYKGDISEEVGESEEISDFSRIMWRTGGIPTAFGLTAFTFAGHGVVPSIYISMKNPQDFEKMVTYAFLAVTILCFVVAISGYYMFGSTVEDQITISLEKADGDNNSMKILTGLMILTAFSKYSLNQFPLALGIEEIVAPFVTSEKSMESVSSLIKIILISTGLAVSVFIPSFSYICSLVGLTCTMIVSIIFPAAAHLILFLSGLSWSEKAFDCFL